MPVSALMLALAAAVVHAVWNVLLARATDPQAATAVAMLVAELVFVPVVALIWRVDWRAWPFLVASASLQIAYFSLLVAAYRVAPLSVVYPIARGMAPVLVLAIGVLVLGHGTSVGQVLGVCLVAAGILLVRGLRSDIGSGVALGLAIGCTIATYTLVDNEGVAHAGAVPYLELTMAPPALVMTAAVLRARGAVALRMEFGSATVVAGIATFGAYSLVLLALQRAAAAPVAAVRETSILVTAVLARRILREPVGWRRFAGAAAVVAGIALLASS